MEASPQRTVCHPISPKFCPGFSNFLCSCNSQHAPPDFFSFQMYPVVSNKKQSASLELECSAPQDQCLDQAGPKLAHGMRWFHAEKHDALHQIERLSVLGIFTLAAAAIAMAAMAQPKFQSLA